jgi:hypothetical protein
MALFLTMCSHQVEQHCTWDVAPPCPFVEVDVSTLQLEVAVSHIVPVRVHPMFVADNLNQKRVGKGVQGLDELLCSTLHDSCGGW